MATVEGVVLCFIYILCICSIFGEQISLVNWDIMHIGGDFSLVNRAKLIGYTLLHDAS